MWLCILTVKYFIYLTCNNAFPQPQPYVNIFWLLLCRFEDDEMERQENPIYGNICLDGGGRFSSQIHLNNQMSVCYLLLIIKLSWWHCYVFNACSGAFEMSPEVCYEQMAQASTVKQGLKVWSSNKLHGNC